MFEFDFLFEWIKVTDLVRFLSCIGYLPIIYGACFLL